MNTHETSRELEAARTHYRGEVLPAAVLAVMDAETARLKTAGLAESALQVGDRPHDFILPDAHGAPVRLYSELRQGPVVLVFYRGGWCPYCNLHLRGFQRRLPRLRELGARLLAVSPQLPDHSLSTQEKDGLEFPVLSDVGNRVARQFRVAFVLSDELVELYRRLGHPLEDFNGAAGANGLPAPATFLIDADGVIRLASVDEDYTRRLDPDDVIAELEAARTGGR